MPEQWPASTRSSRPHLRTKPIPSPPQSLHRHLPPPQPRFWRMPLGCPTRQNIRTIAHGCTLHRPSSSRLDSRSPRRRKFPIHQPMERPRHRQPGRVHSPRHAIGAKHRQRLRHPKLEDHQIRRISQKRHRRHDLRPSNRPELGIQLGPLGQQPNAGRLTFPSHAVGKFQLGHRQRPRSALAGILHAGAQGRTAST